MKKSISVDQLKQLNMDRENVVIIDVRKREAFDLDPVTIRNAIYHAPGDIDNWMSEIPRDRKIVVYCVHGHEVSQGAAETLRNNGFDACYVEGGVEAWKRAGGWAS